VTTAVARGDLGRKITAKRKGEILELKNTINTMVDQLSSFRRRSDARGRRRWHGRILGGQANVPGVAGTWKISRTGDFMAVEPDVAGRKHRRRDDRVAKGRPVTQITAEAKGEILELKNTVTHGGPAQWIRRRGHARRSRGRNGRNSGWSGERPGFAGTWKDLTDSGTSWRQPDESGAQHRARDDGGGQRRSVTEDHRRSDRARCSS